MEENTIKSIGIRIKQLRLEAKLTQEELALKIGSVKGKSSIANYENGSNLPSDEVKLKMCEIFNCSLDYLMCKTNIKNIEKDFQFAYHKETEGLSDAEIKEALDIYRMLKNRKKKE